MVRREASRARDEQQSVQAEAELAVRTARRAACRLKVLVRLVEWHRGTMEASDVYRVHLEAF